MAKVVPAHFGDIRPGRLGLRHGLLGVLETNGLVQLQQLGPNRLQTLVGRTVVLLQALHVGIRGRQVEGSRLLLELCAAQLLHAPDAGGLGCGYGCLALPDRVADGLLLLRLALRLEEGLGVRGLDHPHEVLAKQAGLLGERCHAGLGNRAGTNVLCPHCQGLAEEHLQLGLAAALVGHHRLQDVRGHGLPVGGHKAILDAVEK
mmetsp:Transcript_19068/g.72889  ORF Transcript_19068/g.72889 Transcript_19068/m.72889 type:complete len:204 (-) Transcript_19068:4670-5281(-)